MPLNLECKLTTPLCRHFVDFLESSKINFLLPVKISFHFQVYKKMRVASFLRLNWLISERFGSWLLYWLMTHRAANRSSARFQIVFRLFRRFFEFIVFQFWNQILKNKFIFGKLPEKDEFGKKPKLFLKKNRHVRAHNVFFF